jgi:hypothetical protein
MHRNNVIYHIKSLSEAYHLNLEDSAVRLRLLLSYQIIKGDVAKYMSKNKGAVALTTEKS